MTAGGETPWLRCGRSGHSSRWYRFPGDHHANRDERCKHLSLICMVEHQNTRLLDHPIRSLETSGRRDTKTTICASLYVDLACPCQRAIVFFQTLRNRPRKFIMVGLRQRAEKRLANSSLQKGTLRCCPVPDAEE